MSVRTHFHLPCVRSAHLRLRLLGAVAVAVLLSCALNVPANGESPGQVVATIKPVHSLVSAVMVGVGDPYLIMRGASSPHTYNLRPSDAARLQDAQVVFLIGEGVETALMRPIAALTGKARVIEFAEVREIVRRPFREGGAFEAHGHEHGPGDLHSQEHEEEEHGDDHASGREDEDGHEHEADEHGAFDQHIWLDPVNAGVMTQVIADTLSEVDPANAAIYAANAESVLQRLDALTEVIAAETAAIRGRPYIVFHDAYQYFEKRFGLTAVGSGVVNSERSLGIRRVNELREKIQELGAACVFSAPRFEQGLVNVLIENTPARSGTVDPLGTTVEQGPELYFSVIRNMADSFNNCLTQGG